MHARLTFILDRLNADFEPTGFGPVRHVREPEGAWAADVVVFEYSHHQTSADPLELEAAIGHLASQFQDDVIDQLSKTWPEVDGKPLFASADLGVACWCLDGTPWCAVGQLNAALAVRDES